MAAEEEQGTYVERSGLAVVHRGERIVATPGSAAVLSPDSADRAAHYYFPVEVVVVGDIGEEVAWQIEQRMWQRLHDALG
jgi:hypothetical protein